MEIIIEHLQLPELVAFLQIQADDAFPSLKDEIRLKTLAEKWRKYAEFCVCRDDDGQLIGMIAFYANNSVSKKAYITHVYISRDFRRNGVFKNMFFMVKDFVKSKGFDIIRLEVQNSNIGAVKTYQKAGFVFFDDDTGDVNSQYMQLHL